MRPLFAGSRLVVPVLMLVMLMAGACSGGGAGADDAAVHPVQLDIRAFGYTPQSPLHVGETLRLTAMIMEPQLLSSEVLIAGECNYNVQLTLRDDGIAPDTAAGDHVYTAEQLWTPALGTGIVAVSLTVHALRKGIDVEDKRLALWLHIEP